MTQITTNVIPNLMTNRWTNERLETMRGIGDEQADAVINAVFKEHGGTNAVNDVMRQLVENDELVTTGLPLIVVKYLEDTEHLPDWVDNKKLKAGSAVFYLHGPEIVMLLFGKALPELYADPHGAHILVVTQRMAKRVHRRIIETAQFVMDVMDTDAFLPHGRGIRTTQKVRLMHAAIRHLMNHENPHWPARWNPEWGEPLSQLDLAGTLMSFSAMVLDGLKKTGVRLSAEEKEAYFHVWRVVGYVLGIHTEFLPVDVADGNELTKNWIAFTHNPSEDSRLLTETLLGFMYSHVPRFLLHDLVTSWIRFWLGKDLADQLGVGPYNWTFAVMHMERGIWDILERIDYALPLLQTINRHLSRRILNGLLTIERGNSRPDFRIPTHLRDKWGVKSHPAKNTPTKETQITQTKENTQVK